MWGSKLFHMFVDDVDDRVEHTLSKFAGKTKAGGTVSMLEDRVVFEGDIDRLEKSSWTEISWCSPKPCTLDGKIHQPCRLCTDWVESRFAEENPTDKKLNRSQKFTHVVKVNHTLRCIGWSTDSRLWEQILPLGASETASGVLWLGLHSLLWGCYWHTWVSPLGDIVRGLETIRSKQRLRELRLFSPEEGRLRYNFIASFTYLMSGGS